MDATVDLTKDSERKVLRDEKGRLLPGQVLNPTGTIPGTRKLGHRIKAQYLEAFNEMGGLKAFIEWGRSHKTEFYRMVSQLLPKELEQEIIAEVNIDADVRVSEVERNAQEALLSRLGAYFQD